MGFQHQRNIEPVISGTFCSELFQQHELIREQNNAGTFFRHSIYAFGNFTFSLTQLFIDYNVVELSCCGRQRCFLEVLRIVKVHCICLVCVYVLVYKSSNVLLFYMFHPLISDQYASFFYLESCGNQQRLTLYTSEDKQCQFIVLRPFVLTVI